MDRELTTSDKEARERAAALQATLDELRPQLIDAEAQLAERLAAISAFEYRLRARLEPLSQRLDALQAEIDELRRLLRQSVERQLEGAGEATDAPETWRFEESAAASGAYRYRRAAAAPRPAPEGKRLAALKQLYRQLARRFHPDLALDEADRAYRTDLMMTINAAYAAGDLERLEALADEPDTAPREPRTLPERIETLQREVDHCRRRLAEIAAELDTLEQHNSARLMRRAERAAAAGRDLLAELAADLRLRIAEKMAERDVLETQLDELEQDEVAMSAGDLADIVYNLGLEQADEDDLLGGRAGWRPRNPRPWQTNDGDEEDILDDSD